MYMAAMNSPMKRQRHDHRSNRKVVMINKGAWTAEEDRKLAEAVAVHGPKRWKTVAAKAGLNRCGKSCRLRWLNYLRPNIKRGNISDQEEDLILRLHKLLGNRWSLIAGRLPGRTDNEIKNYWNSHLSKKVKQQQEAEKDNKDSGSSGEELTRAKTTSVFQEKIMKEQEKNNNINMGKNEDAASNGEDRESCGFNVDDFFDFSGEDPLNLEWISRFLHLGGGV